MTESAESPNAPDQAQQYIPGQVIGDKYRLEKKVGEGGMASVWLATNFVLDVAVAVKLIRADTEADDSAFRMLQEAKAVARLGHPAIVRIFDFGQTQDGSPFIAMEYLHGETLADRLDREGSLSAIKAVQLMLPIADGLSVAHGKGIVHRDLKPENIFLARDEAGRLQPKVLDFGIAKLGDSPKGKVTLDGSLLGSPDYMAPEQAQGLDEVDHRTDVWAFCVVLYEMLCGEPPFEGNNYNALLRSIINDPAKSILEHKAGDDDLWTILETGLAKSPDERWEGIHELGEALAYWLYRRGVTEDVCAASLTTTWLDSGLSGVSVRRNSAMPPAHNPLSVPPASGPRLSRASAVQSSNPPGAASLVGPYATGSDRPVKLVSVVPRQVARRSSIRGAVYGGIATAIAIAIAIMLVYALAPDVPKQDSGGIDAVGPAAPGVVGVSDLEGAKPGATGAPVDSAVAQPTATASTDAPTEDGAKQPPVAPRRRVVPRKGTTKKASRPNEIDMGF